MSVGTPVRSLAAVCSSCSTLGILCILLLGSVWLANAQAATLVSKRAGPLLLNNAPNASIASVSVSGDGNVIAFRTRATNLLGPNSPTGLYVFQRSSGVLTPISSEQERFATPPALSSDGRYIVFHETINDRAGRVVRQDLLTGERLVVASSPTNLLLGPDMSVDGRFITLTTRADLFDEGAFSSGIDAYLFDAQTQTLQNISANIESSLDDVRISGDGRFVIYHIELVSSADRDAGLVPGYYLYEVASNEHRLLDVPVRSFPLIHIDGGTQVAISLPNGTQSVIHNIERRTDQVVEGVVVALSEDGTHALVQSTAALDGIERPNAPRFGESFLLDLDTGVYTYPGATGLWEISDDGRLIVLGTRAPRDELPGLSTGEFIDVPNILQLYLFDAATQTFEQIFPGRPALVVEGGAGDSWDPAISGAGDLVAFSSSADDLTANDTNLFRDIFLVDRSTGSPVNSTRNLTAGGNGESFDPVLSKDGTMLAYVTEATNLFEGDDNGSTHDIVLQEINGNRTLVTRGGDGSSSQPHLSRNGRLLTFASTASNLVATDLNGSREDVFLYDRDSGTTTLITAGGDGPSTAPSISSDGRFVVFRSEAENLVVNASLQRDWNLFVYDVASGSIRHINRDVALHLDFSRPIISPDGRWVAVHSHPFSLRTSLQSSLLLFDLQSETLLNLSENSFSNSFLPGEFSADSQTLAFSSHDARLVAPDPNGQIRDIYLYNLTSGSYQRVFSGANANSGGAALSDDANVVVFDSIATNIASDNNLQFSDVFLVDLSAPNEAPTASSTDFELLEDTSVTFTLAGVDPEGDVLSFEIFGQPTNGFVSEALDGIASSFTYRPNPDFSGQDGLSFRVNDGQNFSSAANVSFLVQPVNDPPIALDQTLQVVSGAVLTIDIDAQDIDSEDLNFNVFESPANGQLSASSGSITTALSYTAAAGFVGTDSFAYNVSDGETTSVMPGRITITVTPGPTNGNSAPEVQNRTLDVAGRETTAFTLDATDPEGDALTFRLASGPSHGTLTGTPPTFTYSPNSGFGGEDRLTFVANDGQVDSAAAVVRFLVGTPQLFSAVLPTSRSVGVGVTATVFTTVVNNSAIVAEGCSFSLTSNSDNPDNIDFSYAATDAENSIVGNLNQSFEIAPNGAGSFVMLVRSDQVVAPTQLLWEPVCSRGSQPPVIDGVNTLQFSATDSPAPDILAIAATLQNDGVMHLSDAGAAGIAAVNIRAAGELLVRPRVTGAPSLQVSICQTDPVSGACIEPPSANLSLMFAAESVLTFSVFGSTAEGLVLDPANRRIFVEFIDLGGSLRGATSIAVEGGP